MKRVGLHAAFLTIILLAALSLGCAMFSPVDACGAFLKHIERGDYAKAYSMLHSSVRYDEKRQKSVEAANKQQPETTISKEQFERRYSAIFEALKIKGFSFTLLSATEGDAICVYDYSLTYESELLDLEQMRFRMVLRYEDGRWAVEWHPSLILPELDWGDTVRISSLAARRGEILSDGTVYAQTENAISVLAILNKIEDRAQFLRQTSLLLNLSQEYISRALNSAKGDYVLLKRFYKDEYSELLENELLLIPGISIDKANFGTLRSYPQGESLAHIIGYVGPISKDDLVKLTGFEEGDSQYNIDSRIGKSGLEASYEAELRGKDGKMVYISAPDGAVKKVISRVEAQDGLDIELSLLPKLQSRAEALLKYTLYGDDTAGAVVVLNPKSGAVLAMVSYPSYDLNLFSRGMTSLQWEALASRQNAPMFNRLTQGRYPPGSIFKPFTAAVALESGAMTKETAFPQSIERIEDDKWIPSDSGEFGPWGYAAITRVALRNRHSPLNMHNGIIDSDNIYFAYASLRTGETLFSELLQKAGLDEAMPFELPISPAQLKNSDTSWTKMLLAESSFGQGEVLITPLHAAYAFSAFANNGSIMEPYFIKGFYYTKENRYVPKELHEESVWKQDAVSKDAVRIIEPMLKDVIVSGTGQYLNLANVAGKTGTAQIGSDRSREISWFVGYRLNTNDPRLVLVMLELPANSEEFSRVKFKIAAALLKEEQL